MTKYFVKYTVSNGFNTTESSIFFTTDNIEKSWKELQERRHMFHLEIESITYLGESKQND